MKKKTEAEFKAWQEDVRSKLPVGLKGKFDELVADEEVGLNIFGGYQREADYYKRLNEMQEAQRQVEKNQGLLGAAVQKFAADVTSVKDWYETEAQKNENLLNENEQLKGLVNAARAKMAEYGLEDLTPGTPQVGHSQAADARLREEHEALKQYVIGMDRAVPQVLRQALKVAVKGIKEGYDFDPDQLFDYTQQNRVDLPTAFDRLTADQRATRVQKEQEEALAKAKEEGRREALSRSASPDRFGPQAVARIAEIQSSKPTNSMDRVRSAVEAFYEQDGGKTGTL